jgi:type I restriction enzyme S subunit
VVTGNTPPTSNSEYYDNGSYLWASPADLGISKNITETKTKLSLSGFRKTRNIPKGSVLITCIGSTIGKMGMATETMSSNQQINSIVINDKSDSDFVYYAISRAFPRYLSEVGIQAVPILSKSNFEKLPNYTTCREEQDKIGYFLNLLDERIATQNKIIDKLQSLIKGIRVCCMQRVYGNNVHLSEIAQIYQPQTISSTELTEDGFLVYGANGIIGKYKDYNHETEQICITCRGNTCGMVNYTKPMSWITGNAMVINTDKYQDKVCKRYLYHYLSGYNFNSIISGSGQPQIVRTPLEKLKITLPTISEQKQKAMILDKNQDKIDISHKILNLYIRQKQHLLRQMFI